MCVCVCVCVFVCVYICMCDHECDACMYQTIAPTTHRFINQINEQTQQEKHNQKTKHKNK